MEFFATGRDGWRGVTPPSRPPPSRCAMADAPAVRPYQAVIVEVDGGAMADAPAVSPYQAEIVDVDGRDGSPSRPQPSRPP